MKYSINLGLPIVAITGLLYPMMKVFIEIIFPIKEQSRTSPQFGYHGIWQWLLHWYGHTYGPHIQEFNSELTCTIYTRNISTHLLSLSYSKLKTGLKQIGNALKATVFRMEKKWGKIEGQDKNNSVYIICPFIVLTPTLPSPFSSKKLSNMVKSYHLLQVTF